MRRRTAAAAVTLGALICGAGAGAHHLAAGHVAYYTGDSPRTLSCVLCHVDARGGTVLDRVIHPSYKTPLAIAVGAGGRRLYVTAQDAGALLVVDAVERRLVSEIKVGRRPHSVALSRDGAIAYVSNQESDTISVVDLDRGKVTATLPAGFAPAGIALDPGGGEAFVANSQGGDVSVVDLSAGVERTRLAAGSYPYGVVAAPSGGVLFVTNQLARAGRPPAPPVSEVTVIDAARGKVISRIGLSGAHLLEGAAFAPEGDIALVTLVRPKNLVPVLQVERGWVMTGGFAVIDLRSGRAVQLPLDDVDSFYADPSDVAITPDGRYAFVSHGGVDTVSVIDIKAVRDLLRESSEEDLASYANRLDVSRRYVVKRLRTGSNPRGLAVSPDGRFVYVAERLGDRIGIIEVARLESAGEIDLGGPRHETMVRRGEKVFNSAAFTLQRQFSCRSCHPDNHMDRLQYDFEPDGLGRNIVDNRTMLGIRDTAPFKWNGKNTSVYMQCGIRFARVLMRSESFSMGDLAALVAFLDSLDPPRNRYRLPGGAMTPAQQRGKENFERAAKRDGTAIPESNRCVTCHPGPRFTNRKKADVGSASPHDGESAFDTPQLDDLTMSAPYLHDGRAMTLEEIWTLYSPDDTHGVTSDLGKDGLNDLIEYLKTL